MWDVKHTLILTLISLLLIIMPLYFSLSQESISYEVLTMTDGSL